MDAPFCVAQVDPATGKHTRAYFFLGAVPEAVMDAARRGRPHPKDIRQLDWAPRDAEILRRYYGSKWRAALTAKDPPDDTRSGGASLSGLDFEDSLDLDSLEDAAPEPADYSPGYSAAPTFSDLAIYPEDTIFDLRLKLQCASGIPLGRVHLFYYVDGSDDPRLPYSVTVDGAPTVVDWRALTRTNVGSAGTNSRQSVAGIAVDPRALERREGLAVSAYDWARTIGLASSGLASAGLASAGFASAGLAPAGLASAGLAGASFGNDRINKAYFVDLFAIIPPLGAPERPNDGLAAILRDRYQFDLLWYGALAKYWPQLGPAGCHAALSAAPSHGLPADISSRFMAERRLADAAHAWKPSAAPGARSSTAVTSAMINVRPRAVRTAVNVRNVFDLVPLSKQLPAATVRFEVDTHAAAYVRRPGERASSAMPVFASKRHATSYTGRTAAAIESFVGRSQPRTAAAAFAIAQDRIAILTLYASGHYTVSADWREDTRTSFGDVDREIAAMTRGLIGQINALGGLVFPMRDSLPEVSAGAYSVGELTVSVFWPHALTTAAFRELKERFRMYEKAGIVEIRGLQQGGAYVFTFRKGITAAAMAAEPGINQYSVLFAPTDVGPDRPLPAGGRPVKLHHRATDLRIEFEAGSMSEFELIRSYLLSFLDSLLTGPGRIRVATAETTIEPSTGTMASRRLRRLQERDPELFDLKKYNPDATVYSVLCQSDRQPAVYSAAEAAVLGARRRAALVPYWNYTEQAPAYYECPSRKFPHLSLRSGQHPLGYCLPCCKKARPVEGSRAALAHEECLARNGNSSGAADESGSRHVLAYGKTIPAGRISECAPEVTGGLFLGAVPQPYTLCMIGVEQVAPAVPDAGFAFALQHVLGADLRQLAAAVADMTDTYYRLGAGAAAVFPSAADLANAILGAFVRQDADLNPFGPGGAAAESWPAILMDLASIVYTVTVVRLVAETRDSHMLVASAAAAATIATRAGAVALVVTGPMGTYPVSALDPKLYLRTAVGDRWMVERKVFEFSELTSDLHQSEVVDTVAERIRAALQSSVPAPTGAMTYDQVLAVSGHTVTARLVDMRDTCYALMLTGPEGSVYAPIERCAYPHDGLPTIVGARPAVSLPKAALMSFLAAASRQAASHQPATAEAPGAEPTAFELRRDGAAVGFVRAGLYYHHDPAPPTPGAAIIEMPYDSREVDIAIIAAAEAGSRQPARPSAAVADAASWRNNLYRLFVAEFAALLQRDRNTKLRQTIYAKVNSCRFTNRESLDELRNWLSSTLREYPRDLAAIREALQAAYSTNPRTAAAAAVAALEATAFSFDRKTLQTLRALPTHAEVVQACRTILANHIEIGDNTTGVANIYTACSTVANLHQTDSRQADSRETSPQCGRGKLLVPADRIDDFYDLLAADVCNPYRETALLNSGGVLDPLEFISRPGETLTVRVGD